MPRAAEKPKEDEVNLDAFLRIYREELAKAAEANKAEYPWWHGPTLAVPGNTFEERLDVVYQRMVKAVDHMSFNKDSRAFRETCKRLGIKHTYAAIKVYVETP